MQVVDSGGTTNTLTTDASGYYGVTNIAAGAATITASKTGYTPATATPTIVAGPNTQDIQLTASTPTLALAEFRQGFVAEQRRAGALANRLRGRLGQLRPLPAGCRGRPVDQGQRRTHSRGEFGRRGGLRSGRPGAKPLRDPRSYRLVELEEQGTTQVYGPFALRAEAPAPATAAVRSSPDKPPPSRSRRRPGPRPASRRPRAPPPLPLSALDGSQFVKITTTNSGIQYVTAASLAGLLGQAQADIQAAIAAGSFRLSNQGQPVGYLPNADGSALSFYAEPLKNNYTAQNVYWLTAGTAAPLGSVDGQAPRLGPGCRRLGRNRFLPGETGPRAGPAGRAHPGAGSESGLLDVAAAGGGPARCSTPPASPSRWITCRPAAAPSPNSPSALLGGSEATHTVQVTLNGTVVGQDTWQGRAPHNTVLQLSSACSWKGPIASASRRCPTAPALPASGI